MSNFVCEVCGKTILDSPDGYTTGCEHYDPEEAELDKADEIYEELKVKVCKSDIQNMLEAQGCVFNGQELLDKHELDLNKECYCGRPLRERKAGI